MSLSDQLWIPSTAQVTVLQARGLRIKGKNGTNDAYAVMQLGKEKYQTSVAEKTVAPVWKEEASFDMPSANQGGTERGTLHVHVLHRALVGPDKLLGQAVINLIQLNENQSRDKTQWFKLLDKSGKPDKDRGEVLVDIQFTRNNMTASMFDISAAGKSRSRLSKFKDKVRGKKKEDALSETSSNVVPAFSQVMTDSEEDGGSDGDGAAAGTEPKKKNKVKSLFSHKTNLQKSFSQSMSVLPGKNSPLSGSMSSGLNVEASEGKKKFKFLSHKRTGSSGKKDQKLLAEQSNLCINGSHVYYEEPAPRTSRASSNFSLASSGVGSMEDVPDSSPPSVGSRRSVRHSSPWTEEEEEEEKETIEASTQEVGEEMFRRQELEKLAEDKRRMEEEERRREDEEKRRREEEERIRMDEEKRRQDEEIRTEEKRKRREDQERKEEELRMDREREEQRVEEARKLDEERIRFEREKERQREEEERLEEEEKRMQQLQEEQERIRQEEERRRLEKEKAALEKKRIEEEEQRVRKEQEYERLRTEQRKLEEEEKRRRDKDRLAEEERRQEKERQRREEKKLEQTRLAEKERREKEEKLERTRLAEEERRKREEEKLEKARLAEEEQRREEEERLKREEEKLEKARLAEEEQRREEEERRKREEEKLKKAEEERRQKEEKKRREEEKLEMARLAEEERLRREEEKLEKERLAEEEQRREEEKRRKEEKERQRKEEEAQKRKEKLEKERLAEEERRRENEGIQRREKEARQGKEEEEKQEKERLAEEERRREEEKRRQEEEEGMEEPQRHFKTAADTHDCADITSTNPFEESDEDNPFEDVPERTVTSARQRCKLPVDRNTCSFGEKDVSATQRGKRQAPKPPKMNLSERQRAAQHEAQANKSSRDIKTASILPQRAVQKINPVMVASSPTNNSGKTDRGSGRKPAPQRPGLTEEEILLPKVSQGPILKSKQAPAVSSYNPFEDNEEVDALSDTTATAASAKCSPPLEQSIVKDTVSEIKAKSSKTVHAPTPPAENNRTLGTDTSLKVTQSDVDVEKDCAPVQETLHKEAAQEEAVKKDAPSVPSRRLQPVRPLNSPNQPPVSTIQEQKADKPSGEIISSQGNENVKDTGPYALLTREELISLVLKQESQLLEKSKKISELEQYIDQLLVRVIEEAPNILMTMTPLK